MKRFWLILAAVFLTVGLMYLRFPYERLAARLESELDARGPWRISLVDLGPRPTLLGPGLSAGPVTLRHDNGSELAADELVMRLAWSPSWLRLAPALAIELSGAAGSVSGTLTLGDPPRFDGSLQDVDLASLVAVVQARDLVLSGRLDADLELAMPELGPEGPVHLSAREGSFGHPAFPLDIPFERLDAELVWGDGSWLTITSADLQSPLLSGQAEGTVGRPPEGAIDVSLWLEPEQAAQGLLRAQGIRPGRDGRVTLRIDGTASDLRVR